MKTLILSFLSILISYAFYGQELTGQWNGTLNVLREEPYGQGTELRIIFHVTKADNQFKATMDSPDQNVSGIPVTIVNFNDPNVKFEISNIGIVFEGTLSDNRITGKWMQSGQTFQLVLTKAEDQPGKNGPTLTGVFQNSNPVTAIVVQ